MSNRDRWALIGLNTTDGSDVVSFEFYPDSNSKNALANPFYAGVEARLPLLLIAGGHEEG